MKELEPMLAAGEINASLSDAPAGRSADGTDRVRRVKVAAYRLRQWLGSPRPYLMLLGFGLFFAFWYLTVEVWKLPRFSQMPGPTTVISCLLYTSPSPRDS